MINRPPTQRGFSIPEMLAVVAIIVIILSILLPNLSKSKAAAYDVMCKNNLHQLHAAYTARNADVRARTVDVIVPFNWPAQLMEYLGKDNRPYRCEGVVHDASLSNSANNVSLKVYNAYPGGYLYDMSMVAGPLCRQVDKNTTDATIDYLWSAYPGIAATIKSYRGNLPPNSYLLCFEDLRPDGGDKDFEDVIFQITEAADGVDVKFLYDGAGYQFDLVDGSGKVLWAQLDNGGQTKPGSVITIPGAPTSYGMTNQAPAKFRTGGKNVIFMLDYERSVANCAASSGFDPWNDWLKDNNIERFARHWDKANCMFFDGGVRLLDTFTINPKFSQSRIDYWVP
jgi:prepilin-type N-terminal cleavage/methylation domain-containing protein